MLPEKFNYCAAKLVGKPNSPRDNGCFTRLTSIFTRLAFKITRLTLKITSLAREITSLPRKSKEWTVAFGSPNAT